MKIVKFGGSSLADAGRMASVADIIGEEAAAGALVVVLSAMQGVTDGLLTAAQEAERIPTESLFPDRLGERHREVLRQWAPSDGAAIKRVELLTTRLREMLHGIALVQECTKRTLDYLLGFGERLSCLTMKAILQARGVASRMVDARDLIVTNDRHGMATVDLEQSYHRITDTIDDSIEIAILPGFIGATPEGITTTLGRNGSDYTASIVGAALQAEVIDIWTDVNGVLSADPTIVPDAFVLHYVSFQEAMELSYFGAQVIHPHTMFPLLERMIPIRIRNTLAPTEPGTLISERPSGSAITGIASIPGVSLINITGSGMVGVSGMAAKVFGAISEAQVNVMMISQASSEHSICLVCRTEEAQVAIERLRRGLAEEITGRRIDSPELIEGMEIVAVIGANMCGTPGIAARLFGALGSKQINVVAIAQGSSEMNISFVIEQSQCPDALNAIHATFFDRHNAI